MTKLIFPLCLFFFIVSSFCISKTGDDPAVCDLDSYYDVIIENNIFRPLGWRPPARIIPYELISTITYPLYSKKRPTAILKQTTGQQTHFVSIGDKLNDTLVVDIAPKKVVLDVSGERITLKVSSVFLNASGRSRPRRISTRSTSTNDPSAPKIFMPKQVISVPF